MPLREWPAVLRPLDGETLSSWIARIAGVYEFDVRTLVTEHLGWSADTLRDIDLAPSKQVQDISALGRLDEAFVQTHTITSSYPHWLPDWVTLRPAAWNTSEQRAVLPQGVLFNFCSACLREDLDRGGQFIRIEWLCAATTICVRHLVPLRGLQPGNPPFECRYTGIGARFFSYPSRQLLDAELTATNTMIALAARFERNIRAGLTLSYGSSNGVLEEKAKEVIAAVEDLAWALLQVVGTNGTRVIHCLQSAPFPVLRVGAIGARSRRFPGLTWAYVGRSLQ